MARIAGVNIPSNKKLEFSLRYIYGVGSANALVICKKAQVDSDKRVSELTEAEIGKLRSCMGEVCVVEGDLRKEVAMNIKALIDMKSYRGLRHLRKLPVRGQRTHTNARTRKGRAVPIAGKKVASK